MGRLTEFYILGSSKPVDFFRVDDSVVYSTPFDKIGHHFPSLPIHGVRSYAREQGSTHQGLVIGVNKDSYLFVSYDEDENFNWGWQPVTRGRQGTLLNQLFQGKLTLPFKMLNGIENRTLHTRGPYVVVVDCSTLSRKGRPTPSQIKEAILMHAHNLHKPVETALFFENDNFGPFQRAEFGVPIINSLDHSTGSLEKRVDGFIQHVGRKHLPRVYR